MGSTTILTLHEADATASHFRDTDSFRPHPDAADAGRPAGQRGKAMPGLPDGFMHAYAGHCSSRARVAATTSTPGPSRPVRGMLHHGTRGA